MKSWIHEISESYVAGHKPVRRDLKEHYASLTEKEQFDLLSENVMNYLDEQLQNAYGIGIDYLEEKQQLDELFPALIAAAAPLLAKLGTAAAGVAGAAKGALAGTKMAGLLAGAKKAAGSVLAGNTGKIITAQTALDGAGKAAGAVGAGARNATRPQTGPSEEEEPETQ